MLVEIDARRNHCVIVHCGAWWIHDRLRGICAVIFLYILWTIAIVLLVLWFLGLVTSYTMGGFIHILLIIAAIVVLVRIIRGDKIIA